MLRLTTAVAFAALALGASPLLAAQKFIPLGHSDLEQTAELPKFGTPAADFNLESDIYETRNYMRKKELKEIDNQFWRLNRHDESNPGSNFIDY